NPAKLADCENWPKPTTGKHIQQFLGFVNYWRDNSKSKKHQILTIFTINLLYDTIFNLLILLL
ncbi:hypothetical protein PROFUN_16204, partial [Planoprotostelium fungivorum]